jgi:hypothetical protein
MKLTRLAASVLALVCGSLACSETEVTQEAIPYAQLSVPTANVASYFVQSRCWPDDANDPRACPVAVPQDGAMTVKWRRADWGSNGVPYYQISDSFLADDGNSIVQTWSYSPWQGFNAANGDGGQVAYIDTITARYNLTQDGGTPGKQYFVGPNCGGEGWLLFDFRLGIGGLPYGQGWIGKVANLSIATDPSQCPPLGQAWTQWRYEPVFYPFIVNGNRAVRAIGTIIVEHYDHVDIPSSVYMERAYLGEGYGWLRWEAWESGSGQRPVSGDLAQRCPTVSIPNLADGSDYWGAPLPGWQLYDCRNSTQIVSVSGWSADQFRWP